MTSASDEDVVPVSVRLGEVIPPEDPEDWTRPLTWVVAAGMLLAPALALGWFSVAPPTAGAIVPMTAVLAAALAGGGATAGATQLGVARAWTTTLGAALFAGLAVVVLGAVTAGERQTGAASPTLEHAFTAGLAGVVGAAVAAAVAASVARWASRVRRLVPALIGGVGAALVVLGLLPR